MVARPTAAGHRDAAHRGVDRRSAGAGRARNRRRGPRFPARRRRPERRQLPVDASRRAAAAAALDPARRSARRDRLADGRGAHRGDRRPLLRRAGREPRRRRAGGERGRRRAAADSVERRVHRERARGGAERGIDIVESRSSRSRHFTSLVSIKLHTSDGERWVEGTVFEPNSPRLVSVRGVNVEAPLAGTMLIIANDDQPGVIGEVGTILGRHGVNIANFALGRNETGAVGVVNVDEDESPPRSARRRGGRPFGACRPSAKRGYSADDRARLELGLACSQGLIACSSLRPHLHAHIQRRRDGRARAAASRPPPARRRRDTSSADRFRWSPVDPPHRARPGAARPFR